jgi:tRNA threonylcarbamoyladenosine biosynthesis protein TsaB
MMTTLAIDTATAATAVALRTPGGELVEARDDPTAGARPGHTTRLLALVDGLLSDTGLDWGALELIAVGLGPGTFTGLRVGVCSARALAQSLSIPVTGVSSLAALAHGALSCPEVAAATVLAVLDARRGEVFAAAYGHTGELSAPRALRPEQLQSVLDQTPGVDGWLAVGDGAVRFTEILAGHGVAVAPADSPLHRIGARAVCELAQAAALVDLDELLPEYCRRPDAEIALDGAA